MNINIRLSEEADKDLPWLDHTRVTNLLTCPRWGMVRYILNKKFETTERAMPLDAGHALHQCFAYIRLWYLYRTDPELASTECDRLFGKEGIEVDRAVRPLEIITIPPSTTPIDPTQYQRVLELVPRGKYLCSFLADEELSKGTLETLYTSGFYDDPSDKRRTLSNLETAILLYCQRYEPLGSFYVLEDGATTIENKIEFVVEYVDLGISYRYTGRVDACYRTPSGPVVVDNKTSSNIGGKWNTQWHTSHQLTGYQLWASLVLGEQVQRAAVIALQVPLPAKDEQKGYLVELTSRNSKQFEEFFSWLLSAINIVENFSEMPYEAPLYTHSCYRYFRPCMFLDWCRQDAKGFELGKDALVDAPWDPHEGDN